MIAGTICAYPKFAPVPFHEEDLWNGYPEETNAPTASRRRRSSSAPSPTVAVRDQHDLLLPVNLYGPGDNFDLETSHVIPALIRKMVEAQESGDAEIVLWGDGTRPASSSTSTMRACPRPRGRALRRRRPREPRHGRGDRDPRPRGARAGRDRLRRGDPWDTSKPNGQPRRRLDTTRAEELFGFRAAVPLRDGIARTVAWYRWSVADSTAAPAARPPSALAPLVRGADALTRHVVVALGAIVAAQIAATVALFFSINHNGWLTYQGGDQIWLVTSGWLLGHGTIGYGLTSYGWPLLLAPLTWITGSSSVDLLPLTTILQVCVFGPIATLAVYDIGARLAGRLAGLWCAAAFVAAPFAAIPYFSSATTTRGSTSSFRRRSGSPSRRTSRRSWPCSSRRRSP